MMRHRNCDGFALVSAVGERIWDLRKPSSPPAPGAFKGTNPEYCWAGLVRDEYIGFEVSYGPS